MRVPISYALTYPERAATPVPQLDLASGLSLEFEAPDEETFPLLRLARTAGETGGTAPCAFNAANEVAVEAFVEGRLPFLAIGEVVERVLAQADLSAADDVDALAGADARARALAREAVAGLEPARA
jgi:1-deoxy-D-xylulose-5-phosphate reductoisomerase